MRTEDTPSAWSLTPISLTTARLVVRPFAEADVTPHYLRWLNDRSHMRNSNQRFTQHTAESCLQYLASFDASPNQFLALESGPRLIGTTTVFLDPNHGVVDIGILIGPDFSNSGFATEAVGALTEELLRQGARKVTLGTSSANAAMMHVITKLGFTTDGRRVAQELVDGREADIVHFARFNDHTARL